ncbi:uncharacterized, partial [Tachysurus ichikawai]
QHRKHEVGEVKLLIQTRTAILSTKILNVVSVSSSGLHSGLISSLPPSLQSFTLSGPPESWCPFALLLRCSVFSSFGNLFWSHGLDLEASTRLWNNKVQKRFMESWTGGRRKQELPFTFDVHSV